MNLKNVLLAHLFAWRRYESPALSWRKLLGFSDLNWSSLSLTLLDIINCNVWYKNFAIDDALISWKFKDAVLNCTHLRKTENHCFEATQKILLSNTYYIPWKISISIHTNPHPHFNCTYFWWWTCCRSLWIGHGFLLLIWKRFLLYIEGVWFLKNHVPIPIDLHNSWLVFTYQLFPSLLLSNLSNFQLHWQREFYKNVWKLDNGTKE